MPLNAMELFRLRNINGANYRDVYIQNTRDIIENRFADDPAFRQVEVIGRKDLNLRVSNYRKEGFLMPKMDIQATLDNEFFMGDLFFIDGHYWLCTMKYEFYDVYFRGEIAQCNSILRFQLPNNYEIYELYCVIERPFSKNVSTGQIIQVSDKEYRIRTQLTEVTRRIFLRQRFILNMGYDKDGEEKPDVYDVEARDILSNGIMDNEGFLVLNIKETQYNSKSDNINLMIADYKELPSKWSIIPWGSHIFTPNNKYEVKLGNSLWKLFVANIFDDCCNMIKTLDNIEYNWSIIACELQEKYIELDDSCGNVIKVKCKLPKLDCEIQLLLNSEFELVLNVRDVVNNINFITYNRKIKIVGLV